MKIAKIGHGLLRASDFRLKDQCIVIASPQRRTR